MNYFTGCTNPDELRAVYRRLVFEFHPDRGGDGRKMQEINDLYHQLLKQMDGRQFKRTTDNGPDWTYHYTEDTEKEIAQAIERILKAVGAAPVDVFLVGQWVWVVGDTRPIKEELKRAGCWWNGKRSAWNWRPETARSRFNKNVSLGDILAGGVRVKDDTPPRPALS